MERKLKSVVERWVNEQDPCPSRKQTVRHFPNIPQRIIRSALQARKDRESGADEEFSES